MPDRRISTGKFRDGTERFQDILLEVLPELLNTPEYLVVPYKYIGLLNPQERDNNFSAQFLVSKNKDRSSIFTMFRNEQLAILTPYIKLYRVRTKKAYGSPEPIGQTEEQILMKTAYEVEDFDPHKVALTRSTDDILDVGAGGVERVTYVIRNERPSDQDINVTIDLAFDNLYSFLNSDLTELITFPFQEIPSDSQNIEEKMLKIELGWSQPQDPTNALLDEDEIKIILGMKEVFDLYIVDHNISFDNDGSVRVSVVYQAARQGMMGRPSNNVFALDRLNAFKAARGDIFERFDPSQRNAAVDKLLIFADIISNIVNFLTRVEDLAISIIEANRASPGHKQIVGILNDSWNPNSSYTGVAQNVHNALNTLLNGGVLPGNGTIQVKDEQGNVVAYNAASPIPPNVRKQARQNQIQAILLVFLHDHIYGAESVLRKEGLSAAIEAISATLDSTSKKLFMNYLFYGIRPHLGYVSVEAFSYTPSLVEFSSGGSTTFSYDENFAQQVYGTEEFNDKVAASRQSLQIRKRNTLWMGPTGLGSNQFDAKKALTSKLMQSESMLDMGSNLEGTEGGAGPVVLETGTGPGGGDDILSSDPSSGLGLFNSEQEFEQWVDEHASNAPESKFFPVFFTKLGDIIDCILTFDENVVNDNVLPVIGTARVRTRGGKVIESFNLADLPIELDSFRSFLVNELIRPRRSTVTAQDLVNAVLENYVEPVIDFDKDNINKDNLTSAMVPRRVIPRSRTFIGNKNNHKKFLNEQESDLFRPAGDGIEMDLGLAQTIDQALETDPQNYYMSSRKITQDIGNQFALSGQQRAAPKSDKIKSYLLYYVDFYEFEKLDGKQSTNSALGIPHFRVGLDRGLLISADFAKVDDPKLRDARISAVTSGASTFVLWNPYNVQLTLYGNNLLDKGQLFYIDGNYLGLNSYRKMDEIGIGGYYIAMDIRGEITTSEYLTKVAGIWQYNPNVRGLRRLSVATEIGE